MRQPVIDVLEKFAEDDNLADEVLRYLNAGMWEEWDTSLPEGLKMGFGGDELRIAARSAVSLAKHHQKP